MAKIVFCEDSTLIQKMIQVALRSTPHEIHFAADGVEGLAIIERERPDLIFSDVGMPEMDGFQLTDAVKARSHLAHIPIVFLTAQSDQAGTVESYPGVAGHLLKPFSPEDLRAKIVEYCGGA